jgi:hypothetical protein
MAAVIPRNLQLVSGRLANLERTVVRVRPMSNDAVSAGQTIHFRLPTNTLIDLHNLQFYGHCKIDAGSNDTAWGLPADMAEAIERVDVIVNGQSISGNNMDYGALHHLYRAYWSGEDYLTSYYDDYLVSGDNKFGQLSSSSGTHRSILQGTETADNTVGVYGSSEGGGGSNPPRKFPFLIKGLHGFMDGSFVRFIDTAVLGPVELRIRLHGSNIMYRDTESTGSQGISNNHDSFKAIGTAGAYNDTQPPDFTWENMYMTLDTISFPDDVYRALLAERLAGGGIITIPYNNYFTFTKAMGASSDTITFNLATQSLDMLMATFRNIKYVNKNGKRWSSNARDSNYFKFVSVDNNDYGDGFYNSKTTYQFMVNNKLMPSWPVSVDEAHALTLSAFDNNKRRSGNYRGTSMLKLPGEYRDGNFLFAQALNHHTEQDKIISGMDTRGASSNMAFSVNDANAGNSSVSDQGQYGTVQALIIAKSTSTLEISAGQNVVPIF